MSYTVKVMWVTIKSSAAELMNKLIVDRQQASLYSKRLGILTNLVAQVSSPKVPISHKQLPEKWRESRWGALFSTWYLLESKTTLRFSPSTITYMHGILQLRVKLLASNWKNNASKTISSTLKCSNLHSIQKSLSSPLMLLPCMGRPVRENP